MIKLLEKNTNILYSGRSCFSDAKKKKNNFFKKYLWNLGQTWIIFFKLISQTQNLGLIFFKI